MRARHVRRRCQLLAVCVGLLLGGHRSSGVHPVRGGSIRKRDGPEQLSFVSGGLLSTGDRCIPCAMCNQFFHLMEGASDFTLINCFGEVGLRRLVAIICSWGKVSYSMFSRSHSCVYNYTSRIRSCTESRFMHTCISTDLKQGLAH